MSIGEQIIAAIDRSRMVCEREDWAGGTLPYSWLPNAAEQLEAVVNAHIEERVRVRLKEIMSHDTHQKSINAIRKMIEDGPVDPKAQPWYPTD